MKDKAHTTGQQWNTTAYAASGRFVANLATGVVELLAPRAGEHILDLGCGDGALTEQLAATGAIVTGVDASSTMVAAARARGLHIDHASAAALPYENQFNAVFSNAALHWIRDAEAVLNSVHRALKPKGRFVAEMGGQGNIAAIRTALQAILAPYGIDAEEAAASFFPSPEHYKRLLEQAGFTVQSIDLIPRPTPLPSGMETWLNTFRNGVLDLLSPTDRAAALAKIVALLRPNPLRPPTATGRPTTSGSASTLNIDKSASWISVSDFLPRQCVLYTHIHRFQPPPPRNTSFESPAAAGHSIHQTTPCSTNRNS